MREKRLSNISKAEMTALWEQNPDLEFCRDPMDKKDRRSICNRNIRWEFAHTFVRTKIRINFDKNGRDWARIQWVDGPTIPQVTAILEKYTMGYYEVPRKGIYKGLDGVPMRVVHQTAWTLRFGGMGKFYTKRTESKALISHVAKGMGHSIKAEWLDDNGNFQPCCPLPRPVQVAILAKAKQTAVVQPEIVLPKCYWTEREARDSIELYFEYKPHKVVLDWLRKNRWRWFCYRKCWAQTYSWVTKEVADKFARGELPERM